MSYIICPDLVQCVFSLLGKSWFVLKAIVFLFSFIYFSFRSPTHPRGGALLGLDEVRGGIWEGLHGGCLW